LKKRHKNGYIEPGGAQEEKVLPVASESFILLERRQAQYNSKFLWFFF
jgi:hypothetical protein